MLLRTKVQIDRQTPHTVYTGTVIRESIDYHRLPSNKASYIIMTVTTQCLSRVDQLLLQRLMAHHVLEDKEAKQMLSDIYKNKTMTQMTPSQSQNDEGGEETPKELEECFAAINQQMTKGFGLEISSVVLDRTKYHAVMNSHADEISKKSFDRHFDAHDRQFILLILQHLVDNNDNGTNNGKGIPRRDLYNLRGELEEPYKMSLQGAEHVVESLLQQHWLRTLLLDDDDENRRASMQANLELAPRTYLELSHLLVDMGIPQDDLPQFLFHRL
jgi:hypothetical protein